MFGWFDMDYILLMIPAMVLAGMAQWMVHRAYAKAAQIGNRRGYTGAQAANAILESAGVYDVSIETSHGFLSDHYDPRHRVLRLSPDVYRGRSLAAMGIAAHEAGHAIQHKRSYGPLAIRNSLVPAANIGSNLSWLLILGGFLFGGAHSVLGRNVMMAGILLYSAVVLFQLINLPVEFNASARAKVQLADLGIVDRLEAAPMNKVLNAAAMTYVAATFTAILTLVYFLMKAGLLGGRDD